MDGEMREELDKEKEWMMRRRKNKRKGIRKEKGEERWGGSGKLAQGKGKNWRKGKRKLDRDRKKTELEGGKKNFGEMEEECRG